MEIEEGSQKEWERQRQLLLMKLTSLQNRMNSLTSRGGYNDRAKGLSEQISGVITTLGTMNKMDASTQIYALNGNIASGEAGSILYDNSTGMITLNYNGTANFVHEITHAGQFESGSIGFSRESGKALALDIYDEVFAYQMQYSYAPNSLIGSKVKSLSGITSSWVQNITFNGELLYGPKSNISLYPLGVNSVSADLLKAYPNMNSEFSKYYDTRHGVPYHRMANMHYKQ